MEEEKKVYLGNLEFGLSCDELKRFIESKGVNAVDVKIITDKFSGKSKGFGFAELDTPEAAQAAIEALNGQDLNGRTLRVSKAQKMRPKSERRNDSGGGYNSR